VPITLLFSVIFAANINAQENRSATELAKENIADYLSRKIFSGKNYIPETFQVLKSFKAPFKTNIAWTIGHEFSVAESSTFANEKRKKSRYGFLFYLDKKMTVLRAESYEVR
jgi:hypothetical protein